MQAATRKPASRTKGDNANPFAQNLLCLFAERMLTGKIVADERRFKNGRQLDERRRGESSRLAFKQHPGEPSLHRVKDENCQGIY